MKRFFIVALVITFIDVFIKFILLNSFDLNSSITIIDKFFNITLLGNTGAAFSIFTENTFLLIFISFMALAIIYLFFIKDKSLTKMEEFIYGILIGGILGNLIDRIFRGYVVDYLDFNIFGYNFPVFNFADICIVVSIILLIIYTFKGEKNENRSR